MVTDDLADVVDCVWEGPPSPLPPVLSDSRLLTAAHLPHSVLTPLNNQSQSAPGSGSNHCSQHR